MARKTSLTLSNRVEVYTNDIDSFYDDEDNERENNREEGKKEELVEGDSVEIQL